jgi:hypothetical protein
VTVFGIKAINVNQADAVVLQSISPLINAELAAKIIARRNDPTLGPFTNLKEFLDFLSSAEGGSVNVERLTDEAVPLVFEATHNFRITSVGEFGNVRRTITAITMDFDAIRRNLVESFKADNQPQRPEEDGASSPNQAGGANDSLPPSGGAGASQGDKTPRRPPQRPTIVYWHES